MKKSLEKAKIDASAIRTRIEKGRRGSWWRRTGGKASGFKYLDKKDRVISDEAALDRIKSLVIPPAWKHVRISPAASCKVQAVGMDTTGRIQYLYHPKFAEKRAREKFSKIEKFGQYLPNLRKITNRDIALEGFPREKVLAVVIRLINSLYIRVGTEKSVRQYKTYGVTTLQNRHLEIGRKGQLVFSFVGKHHIKHRKVLVDEELASIMKDLKSLGGARKLFHYLDAENTPRTIKPSDINQYLKQATAPEFTAKDFRTWGGSLIAAIELAELGRAEEENQIKKNILKAVKKVSEHLGNTPTVTRGSYIHPTILKSYESGITLDEFTPRAKRRAKRIEEIDTLEEKALMKLFNKE